MTLAYDALDPRTPVLVGVGESSERIDDADYRARSEVEMAAAAVSAALSDTGADPATVAQALDAAAMTRSFDGMGLGSPFGNPDSYPWAVLRRVGAAPAAVRHEVLGGESPQALVNEFAARIAAGEHEAVLIFGADITSTTRHLTSGAGGSAPDFSETVDVGPVEDRGRGTHLVNDRHGVAHGFVSAPVQYALAENARRHRLGMDRASYRRAMAELMAPMSEVAAKHPHSATSEVRTVDEVASETAANRRVADPYLRLMIARDQVNQGAATVLMSVAAARDLGIAEERWVFLHGHASLRERDVLDRPDLSSSPAAHTAVAHALEVAGAAQDGGIAIGEIDHLDLYSCFPVAVTAVTDAWGIAADDPRGLTVTGGLPYFGGAGSNYALHAIAETVRRVRSTPGTRGLVGANGGLMSKYAVGIYAATPTTWTADDSPALQRRLDAAPAVPHTELADGPAQVETWTVETHRDGRRRGTLVCRDATGDRFLAVTRDEALLDRLDGSDGTDDPTGSTVAVRHDGSVNQAAADRVALEQIVPTPRPRWDREFEAVRVRRDGHLLEITLARAEQHNALDRAAQAELAEVIGAYLADRSLWVAILHGDGDDFCTGVDLSEISWGYVQAGPPTGFGGLTARTDRDKPIIAAVRGAATDAGLELLLACDLVVAAEDARFGMTQAAWGGVAEHGGPERLAGYVGERLAAEMLLTGRLLDAEEACEAGLINRVVSVGDELAAARGLAERVLALSPTSLRAQRRLARGDRSGLDEVSFSEDLLAGLAARSAGVGPQWHNH